MSVVFGRMATERGWVMPIDDGGAAGFEKRTTARDSTLDRCAQELVECRSKSFRPPLPDQGVRRDGRAADAQV